MEPTYRFIRLKFPDLMSFLRTYFHKDWKMDADSAEGIVARFFAHRPTSAELRTMATQTRQFIDTYGDDARIEAALETLDCYYLPRLDRRSARGWLEELHDRMLQEADVAERQYRDLEQFLGSYFHQDWMR